MAKVAWKQLITPEVEFGYPKFRKKDQKYDNYSVNAILTADAAKKLRVAMRQYAMEVYGAQKGKTAKLPNFSEDEENGTYVLKLASKNMPGVFDAKGNVMPDKVMVGGGTKGYLAFTMRPYADVSERIGVTAMLDAAVITKLVEYKGAGGDGLERGKAAFKDLFGKVGDFEFPESTTADDDANEAPWQDTKGRKAASSLDDEDSLDGLSGDEDDDISSL